MKHSIKREVFASLAFGTGSRTVASLLLVALVGCDHTSDDTTLRPTERQVGDTNFVSAAPEANYARGDVATAAEDGSNDESGGAEEREIEEADVIRTDGNRLYVLNAHRGLHIIDITNPDEPSILGNAKVLGHPVEMYIDGDRAYIVVSNYFSYWQGLDDATDAEEWRGSQIVVVDIANPANPQIVNAVNIEGYISDTRRVGEVLYIVSNRWSWYSCTSSTDNVDLTFVASINIQDPDNIFEVERVDFAGSSNFIHVTQDALFVAQYVWGRSDPGAEIDYGADVTYVDISDPAGAIGVRDTVQVPGDLRDKFALDWYDGSFRIITHFWDGVGHSELRTFDTSNPDDIVQQGLLRIEDAGRLMATRFDGERAYTIHLPQAADPLDVIDLSDPYNPTLEAVLEIPGWVSRLEARGDRLVALGVDDTSWPRRASVKLFDVTVANAPVLLDEAPIGEGASWSQADWDPKALTILDDQGLILVPYASWAADAEEYARGVAIVSWTGDDLRARGVAPTKGWVYRTRATSDRMLAMSAEYLEVFDVSDLDNPVATADLELAWYVADFVTMGDYGVQLVGNAWWYGPYSDEPPTRELRVVPLDDPDLGPVVASVDLQAPMGRMFKNGSFIYVASYDTNTDATVVKVFDFTNPLAPVARSSIELDIQGGFDYWGGWLGWWGWSYSGGEIIQSGDTLVLHRQMWWGYAEDVAVDQGAANSSSSDAAATDSGSADAAAADSSSSDAGAADRRAADTSSSDVAATDRRAPEDVDELWIVDLGDPDAPVATRVGLDHLATQVTARDGLVFYTYWKPVEVEGSPHTWAAYYLGRVTLLDPSNPVVLAGVNIPGQFIDANDDEGTIIYTLDWLWTEETGTRQSSLNILSLTGDSATLLGRLDLAASDNSYLSGIRIEDNVAHMTEQRWSNSCGEPPTMAYTLLDARNPSAPTIAGEFVLSGYGYLMAVDGNRTFLSAGDGEGLLVMDTTDINSPAILGSFRTQGYPTAIRLDGDRAFLPSGYYGVQAFSLSTGTPLR